MWEGATSPLGVKLPINLKNEVVQFILSLNSANLICRGTDIWKYFRESYGFGDNESRLYTFSLSACFPLNGHLAIAFSSQLRQW